MVKFIGCRSMYLILKDNEDGFLSPGWRSMRRFQDYFENLRSQGHKNLVFFDLKESEPNEEIFRLQQFIKKIRSQSGPDRKLTIIYGTYKFPLFRLTREKWFREMDVEHLFVPFGGLLMNPNMTMMMLYPLKNRKVSFLASTETLAESYSRIFDQVSILKLSLPCEWNVTEMDDSPTFNSAGRRAFCYGGRLSEAKGVLEILEAFKKVSLLYPEASLHIAGFPHERSFPLHGKANNKDRIKRGLASIAKSDKVYFHGDLSRENWLKLLSSMDFFIYPSTGYEEDYAVSVLEAKALQRPCIMTRWSVLKDYYIDGVDIQVPTSLDKGIASFNNSDLARAMIKAQKIERLQPGFLPPTICKKNWWQSLLEKLEQTEFRGFEFSKEYHEYRNLFLENGHAPFESVETNKNARKLHEFFCQDLV